MTPFTWRCSLVLMLALATVSGGSCVPVNGTSDEDPAPASAGPAALDPAGAVQFAVIGDTGTGAAPQYRVAASLAAARNAVPFDFVLMLGDNLYDVEDRVPSPTDYATRFERPYAKLLEAGVKFYASLGNHDRIEQTHYRAFNMGGRYYTFKPRGTAVRFFALDSNSMDAGQLAWIEKEMRGSGADWKIVFFHHPIYSSGMEYGPDLALRERLEPLFIRHKVDAVFAGHEHFYERIKPQGGVHYFIAGNGGKLRRGNLRPSAITAAGYDQGRGFMLVSVDGAQFWFQSRDERGRVVDEGVINRPRRE